MGVSAALLAVAGCDNTGQGVDQESPAASSTPDEMGKNLGFDRSDAAGKPADWDISRPSIVADSDIRRSGKSSVRISEPSLVSQCFAPTEQRGKQLELSAHMKTEARSEFVADLQISSYVDAAVSRTVSLTRVIFEGPDAKSDTGIEQGITSTVDWTRKAVAVDVHPDSVEVCISVIARGDGTLWSDDLALVAR